MSTEILFQVTSGSIAGITSEVRLVPGHQGCWVSPLFTKGINDPPALRTLLLDRLIFEFAVITLSPYQLGHFEEIQRIQRADSSGWLLFDRELIVRSQ